MNCKWFEVFLFFLFLASKKSVCPQNAQEDKRENYICAEVGEEAERMRYPAATRNTAFHILKTLCRHPTERGPAPHFWAIPEPRHCGLRDSAKRGFPEAGGGVRLESITVSCISDSISCKINAAFLSLAFFFPVCFFCFKSSANSGLC